MPRLIFAFALVLLASFAANAAEPALSATLYKNPQCGCCEGHAKYLRQNGFAVKVVPTHDLMLIKRENGVPTELAGCHTTLIDGYVVEGHVPINAIKRLLSERPAIKGIALPGMPAGSPGMGGSKTEPLTIYEIAEGSPKVFAVE